MISEHVLVRVDLYGKVHLPCGSFPVALFHILVALAPEARLHIEHVCVIFGNGFPKCRLTQPCDLL